MGGVDPNPSTPLAKAANLEAAVTFLCETGVQLPATAARGVVDPPCVYGGVGGGGGGGACIGTPKHCVLVSICPFSATSTACALLLGMPGSST